MRLLTRHELDLVAGGWGSSESSFPSEDGDDIIVRGPSWGGGHAGPDLGGGTPYPGDPGDLYPGNPPENQVHYEASNFNYTGDAVLFQRALDYLEKSPTAKQFLQWAQDNNLKIVIQNNSSDGYVKGTSDAGVVTWDPHDALDLGNGNYQSAALGLLHEIAHAYYHWEVSLTQNAPSDHDWILPNVENPAAQELGEAIRGSAQEGVPYYEADPAAHDGV